jgi:hypothetical protein
MRTKVGTTLSDAVQTEEGLPQGSALSCSLFLAYVNDIGNHITVEKAMFADDLALWCTGEDEKALATRMQQELANLSIYCADNKMIINELKTVYQLFNRGRNYAVIDALYLSIDGHRVPKDDSPKYLGVELDGKLSLSVHIDRLVKQAKKRLNLMKKLSGTTWGARSIRLRQLYKGYVRPLFDYSAPIQSLAANMHLLKMDGVQNSALRLISGCMASTSIEAMEVLERIEPLDIRREKAVLQTYERLLRMEPTYSATEAVKVKTADKGHKKRTFVQTALALKKVYGLPDDRESFAPGA